MDDEVEPGTTQALRWRVSSAVVAAMNELEADVASWECDNESNPRCGIPG